MRRVERDNEKQDGYGATCLAAANGNQNMEGLEEATISRALHRIHIKNGTVTREGMTGNNEIIQWVLDTSASHHMTPLYSLLKEV